MLYFAVKRLAVAVLVLLTVSVLSFSLLHVSGEPLAEIISHAATQEEIDDIRKHYGFDRPLPVQFWDWASSVLHGNLGYSIYLKETPVSEIIKDRAAVTLTLGAFALSLALLLSVPLGVVAAMHPNTFIDRAVLTFAVIGQAMPNFLFGLILMYVFSVSLGWLPSAGSNTWKHFILPSIALGYYAAPAIIRLTRTSVIEVIASDYVRTARAKGLRPGAVVFKHALRNAIIPVVSLSAAQLGFLLGGSIIIEIIFTLDGLGRLAWQSIHRSDLFVLQGVVLTVALFYVVLTYLADVLNAILDPRIRA